MLGRGFNKLFYTRLMEVEQAAVTKKEAVWPLSTRGSGGMLPQKILIFRSSEMIFPAFWAQKRVLFMIIFIDQ